MAKVVEYSKVKAALWRLGRVFLAGFLANIAIDQLFFGTQDIQLTLLRSGVVGGISAIAKYLREENEKLSKLPL
jgi:hypothetical protein